MKTYKVKFDIRIRQTIEVQTESEEEAEALAHDQLEIHPAFAETYDVNIKEYKRD